MSVVTFTIDGVKVTAESNKTIMEAADETGIYIPRLCAHKELTPFGACRVCTVLVNGRPQAACTQPVAEGITVEHNTEKIKQIRKDIIDMLFVEGNHYCPFCEKSGNCELQAMAYRLGITAPSYPYMFPKRSTDASHPEIFIDQNRCIQCGRCVRASKEKDGKNVFQFVGRGLDKKIAINSSKNLAATEMGGNDNSAFICPVGAILKKGMAFKVPIGERLYDHTPIGTDIENAKNNNK